MARVKQRGSVFVGAQAQIWTPPTVPGTGTGSRGSTRALKKWAVKRALVSCAMRDAE